MRIYVIKNTKMNKFYCVICDFKPGKNNVLQKHLNGKRHKKYESNINK